MRMCFGACELDLETREVTYAGQAVSLSPKAFHLLQILIGERPKALSKARLHGELWPDTFVEDANLVNLVADLRAALGDDAKRPRIIRTIQRFGYAFVARVEARPTSAQDPGTCRLIWGDREITLRTGENILGRDQAAVAWIDVYSVSRQHARLVVTDEGATLEDLGSKNGTFVGGRRITSLEPLRDGDAIRIGTVGLLFRRFAGNISTGTARSR